MKKIIQMFSAFFPTVDKRNNIRNILAHLWFEVQKESPDIPFPSDSLQFPLEGP